MRKIWPTVPQVYLIKLAATLELETHAFNRDIFKEGENTKAMYILKDGQIDIIKDIVEKKYLIKSESMSLAKGTKKTFIVSGKKREVE